MESNSKVEYEEAEEGSIRFAVVEDMNVVDMDAPGWLHLGPGEPVARTLRRFVDEHQASVGRGPLQTELPEDDPAHTEGNEWPEDLSGDEAAAMLNEELADRGYEIVGVMDDSGESIQLKVVELGASPEIPMKRYTLCTVDVQLSFMVREGEDPMPVYNQLSSAADALANHGAVSELTFGPGYSSRPATEREVRDHIYDA
jgi:hypothetical protein